MALCCGAQVNEGAFTELNSTEKLCFISNLNHHSSFFYCIFAAACNMRKVVVIGFVISTNEQFTPIIMIFKVQSNSHVLPMLWSDN